MLRGIVSDSDRAIIISKQLNQLIYKDFFF